MYVVVHDPKVFKTESYCWLIASSCVTTQLIKVWISVLHTNIVVVACLWLHASHVFKVCAKLFSICTVRRHAVDPY